jgi:hypothetical protein
MLALGEFVRCKHPHNQAHCVGLAIVSLERRLDKVLSLGGLKIKGRILIRPKNNLKKLLVPL